MYDYYVVPEDSVLKTELLFGYKVVKMDEPAKVEATRGLVEAAIREDFHRLSGGTQNLVQIIDSDSGELSRPIFGEDLFRLIQNMVLLVSCNEDEIIPPLWRIRIASYINTIILDATLCTRQNRELNWISCTNPAFKVTFTKDESTFTSSMWIGARQSEEGIKFYAVGKADIPTKYHPDRLSELSLHFTDNSLGFRYTYEKVMDVWAGEYPITKHTEVSFEDGIDLVKRSVTDMLLYYKL